MRVSVALAAYNGEKYILSQLSSIAGQTVLPDEVVICDDCSTDKTVSLINDFIAENRLGWQVYINKENVGFINNFRRALSMCTGEVVFLCDQDDIWESNKIESVISVFSSYSEVCAVLSSFSIIGADGKPLVDTVLRNTANNGLIPFSVNGEKTNIGLKTVLCANISPGCTAAFSKDVVDKYLESAESSMPHDWELGIIAATKGKTVYLDRELIKYRLHGENAIGLENAGSGKLKMRGSDKKRFEVLKCRKTQAEYIKNSGFDDGYFMAFLKYTANREKAVFDGKFFPAVKNIIIYPKLKGRFMFPFREVIGDMVFALKHRKGVVSDDK